MLEHEIQNAALKTDTSFPQTTKTGRMVFKDKQVWIAAEIDGSTPFWVPITQEIEHYTHVQTTSSTTWTVTHNLNIADVAVTVYDDATDSVVIPDTITLTDANTVTVTFASAITGKAVVTSGLFDNSIAESGFETLVMNTDSTNGSTTFTDDTSNHTLTPVNGAQHSTASAKFGGTSAFFDADAYIDVNNLAATDIGLSNEPFTVEFWTNFSADDTSYLIGKGGGAAGWNSTNGHQWFLSRSSGLLYFQWYNGSFQFISGSFPITTGQWYHVAAVYDGSVIKLFIDGTQVSASTAGQTFVKPSSSNLMRIGANGVSTETLSNGYIDSVRIEKGYARYTSAFTPPTKRFTV